MTVEEVWGFAEVCVFLDVSRPRAATLVNRPDFPKPQVLASGRVWSATEVREWERKRRERYPRPEESDEL